MESTTTTGQNPVGQVPQNANEHCPGLESTQAGKSEACDGCPNQKICASGQATAEDPHLAEIRAKMSQIKHKILVLSGKGGVGKSTMSSQIALQFAALGYEVGLLDLDICGPSIPRMMGLEGRDVHKSAEGWSPVYVENDLAVMSIGFLLPNQDDAVIWRAPKKTGLIKQFLMDVSWGELDLLIIDSSNRLYKAPPGTSDEHITITQFLQMGSQDGAVIVTTPQMVAINDVKKEVNFCKKSKVPIIGVVENMAGFVCPTCAVGFCLI